MSLNPRDWLVAPAVCCRAVTAGCPDFIGGDAGRQPAGRRVYPIVKAQTEVEWDEEKGTLRALRREQIGG